jgi:hypothetical protein
VGASGGSSPGLPGDEDTRTNDYAISPLEFHWESQSLTRESSATGQRSIHHVERGSRVLLFVRGESRRGGVTLPFLCQGFADCVSHEGERPMAIRWRLGGGAASQERDPCQVPGSHPPLMHLK